MSFCLAYVAQARATRIKLTQAGLLYFSGSAFSFRGEHRGIVSVLPICLNKEEMGWGSPTEMYSAYGRLGALKSALKKLIQGIGVFQKTLEKELERLEW